MKTKNIAEGKKSTDRGKDEEWVIMARANNDERGGILRRLRVDPTTTPTLTAREER